MTFEEALKESMRLCRPTDPKEQALAAKEQAAREAWHASWVRELVRIVKPGKVVVIGECTMTPSRGRVSPESYPLLSSLASEDVGFPLFCEGTAEWGGVKTEWWPRAVDKYGWDVDPQSIHIVVGAWYGNRYNVVMRRNPVPVVREHSSS